MAETLKVRAVEGRLLPWEGDTRRGYVGWSTAPAGQAYDHEIPDAVKLSLSIEQVDVANTIYYRKALSCGDLELVTEETDLPPPAPEPEPEPPPVEVDNTLPPGIDNELPGEQPGIDNELPPELPPIGSTLPEGPAIDNALPQPGIDNTLPETEPASDDAEQER